jgi:hypothetical protein
MKLQVNKNMKNTKTNGLLDIVILLGFLASFFLSLTGLAVHQWLGTALFLGVIFHLVNHLNWVKSVFRRFFTKTSARARIYALIDGLLLYGFVMIVETGLVISTWFNLNLSNYEVWLKIHIDASIATLLLLVLKMGLHWRWIAKTAEKILHPAPQLDHLALPTAPQSAGISRRDFLVTMGLVGLGSALAISNVLPTLKKVAASIEAAQNNDITAAETTAQVQTTNTATPVKAAAASPTNVPVSTTAVQTTAAPATAATLQNNLVCTATCPKGNHCSFPGRCGRYVDHDNNGLCDLGECG